MLPRPLEPEQFTSIRYGERLAEIGAVPSIGSVGDSYDNALAESVNSLYKTELIYGPDQVSTATSATSLQPNTKRPTMPKGAADSSLETNRNRLHQTQGAPDRPY